MESNTTAEAFAEQLAQGDVDPFEALWGAAQAGCCARWLNDASSRQRAQRCQPTGPGADKSAPTGNVASLFSDDYTYLRDALTWLRKASPREYNPVQSDDAKRTLSFQPSSDLAPLAQARAGQRDVADR